MTTQISHFYFEGNSVRIKIINGDPWFVAKDVCAVLNISNSRDAISKLDSDERGVALTDTLSGRQKMAIINESGLYTLILRCRDAVKPGTVPHRFRKWVTNEVLPAIRKTGLYEHPVRKTTHSDAEPLTHSDMKNLNHLVVLMTRQFSRTGSWRRGVWYALRRTTGVASPEEFTVDDLPALTEECRRIIRITSEAGEMISRIEREAVRRIVRHREDCGMVLAELQRECNAQRLDNAGIRQLERYEQIALRKLENRVMA
ncbi:TPA: Bro-N domain-containing protein [Salmonella enterica subsp. diarizonae serovar 60-67:z35:-]